MFTHLIYVRKIARRYIVLLLKADAKLKYRKNSLTQNLNLIVDFIQFLDELFLLLLLADHRWHLFSQLGNDVGVYLRQSGPLYQIVQFSKCRISRQRLHVRKQIVLFVLKQPPIYVIMERMIPERADIDPGHFRGFKHLSVQHCYRKKI